MKKALFGLVAAGWLLTLAASGSQAGAKNGSNRWSVRVPANGTATYNIRFVGGQLAEMAIIGDGTSVRAAESHFSRWAGFGGRGFCEGGLK